MCWSIFVVLIKHFAVGINMMLTVAQKWLIRYTCKLMYNVSMDLGINVWHKLQKRITRPSLAHICQIPPETYNLHVNIGLDQTQPVKPTKHISFCSFCSVQVVPETFFILGGFHRYVQSISALGSSQSLDLWNAKKLSSSKFDYQARKKNLGPKFVTLSLPS